MQGKFLSMSTLQKYHSTVSGGMPLLFKHVNCLTSLFVMHTNILRFDEFDCLLIHDVNSIKLISLIEVLAKNPFTCIQGSRKEK